jgi:hypothetical protein
MERFPHIPWARRSRGLAARRRIRIFQMSKTALLLGFELADKLLPFPSTHPLNFLFASVGLPGRSVDFKINEIDDVITCCVTARIVLRSVLVQPTLQLVRDSGIEETSITVAHNVDVIHAHSLLVGEIRLNGK